MKKDQFERMIETQRKNLKFTSEEAPVDVGRFVVANEQKPEPAPAPVTRPAPVSAPVSHPAAYGSSPRAYGSSREDYVDIRKLKLERKNRKLEEEQENANKNAEQLPASDVKQSEVKTLFSASQPFKTVGQLAVDSGAALKPKPKVEPQVAMPPAPASVLVAAKKSAKKKIDPDLIEKKTYNSYFDDLSC